MKTVNARAVKAAILVVEIVSVFAVAIAALAGFLLWRLDQGPIQVPLLREGLEAAVEKAAGSGHDASIGIAELSRIKSKGLGLVLGDVVVLDKAGAEVASAPRARFVLSLRRWLSGGGPVREADVESLRLVVSARGRAGPSLIETLRDLDGFETARLSNAAISYVDPQSGKVWTAQDLAATFTSENEDFRLKAGGLFDLGGENGRLSLDAVYTKAGGIMTAEAAFERAPLGDLLGLLGREGAPRISAPFSGHATITMDEAGEILSSAIDGVAGAGAITIADRSFPLERLELRAAFDPRAGAFVLEHGTFDASGVKGAVAGTIAVRTTEKGRLRSLTFDLAGQDWRLDPKGVFDAPLEVAEIAVSGAYDAAERRLAATAITAALLDVSLHGQASLRFSGNGASPEARAEIAIDGALDPQRLLKAWPTGLGLGARDFVAMRLPAARITNVAATVALAEGALVAGSGLPDAALAVRFDIDGAEAIYAQTMTPLSNASGKALLTGNRFVIKDARGKVGKVDVSNGEIDFTKLSPKGEPVYFRFDAEGEAPDVLTVLNAEPLEVLKTTSLTPERFSGRTRLNVEIMRPNRREVPRENYRFAAKATFEDVGISEFYRGIDLEGAKGALDLAPDAMTIAADASFGGTPIAATWKQPLGAPQRDGVFTVAGALDSAAGDLFGVPTRQMLHGSAPFKARANGRLGAVRSVKIEADLTPAALTVPQLAWRKPKDAPATAEATIVFTKDGVEFRDLSMSGDGIAVNGSARAGEGGRIDALAFERVKLEGGADFAVSATRAADGPLEIGLTGAFLNASGLIEEIVEARRSQAGSGPGQDPGFMLRARLDRLRMRGGAEYRDASLDLRRQNGKLQDIDFSARTMNGAPLSVGMKSTGADQGPTRSIEARTDDIGALLSGVFGVSSILGGEGSMEIMVGGDTEGLSGICEARGMRVVRAPLLARVFAAGSFTGLADLLNGEGIALNQGFARFRYRDGVLSIDESRASGPSVGITGQGTIGTGDAGVVDLKGAVAPAYQVNSILGKAPLIGDLFVSREGEGVVALSYVVNGPASEPIVSVNPLSALTPGFLRRMFEFEPQPAAQQEETVTQP